MSGVYLTGHGGLDKLVFKEDIPVPIPKSGEVLIQVKGAGINNTDINTAVPILYGTVTVPVQQVQYRYRYCTCILNTVLYVHMNIVQYEYRYSTILM